MTFNDWIDAEVGRISGVAAHFGITPSAVSQWRQNGVPRWHMKAVREITGGAVTLDDMIPDPVEHQQQVQA